MDKEDIKSFVGILLIVIALCFTVPKFMEKIKELQAKKEKSGHHRETQEDLDYEEYRQRQQAAMDLQSATDGLREINNPK